MQLFKSLFLAAAAASTALAFNSGIKPNSDLTTPGRRFERRGPIHDAIGIIQHKKKVGSDFCSTFLHLPPYAATKTVTTTKTLTKQVPLSTTTGTTVLTSTGAPVIVVGTTAVIVPVTPTVDVTVVSAVPFTSTVSTITSVVTQISTVATEVVTVTAVVAIPRNAAPTHDPSRTRLPYWLNQFSCPQVSKACSHIVTPKTKTVTKTASVTVTVKSGVASVGQTSTAVVTPTSTSITTVTSTSTAAAVTSTVVSTSSSLVPITATVDATTVISVTATATTTVQPPPPAALTARVVLKKASDGSAAGYIGPPQSPGYVNPVQDASAALLVQFPATFLATGGPVNFAIPGAYPNLGGIVGSASSNSDLSSSSLNYLYMAAVNTVPANSQSSDTTGQGFSGAGYNKKYESQIWKVAAGTNALTIDWANSNGQVYSAPTFFYDSSVGFLGWTGNLALFSNLFPTETVIPLTATLEVVS
ncbi:hypothetical protein OC846_005778 [Tilletia horrida]|uniref:Uncharacterized protein n=1 Tax=Tilletia horrida TaxID=155126 RepID=A0AAN6JVN4_9BASI|nr:hypothetical protein OC845_006080 [Tilletia horrida]KAK0545164.1 hypothetical protein OC846_005778 [Tilletia horrida]KAK0560439.1 hypothetical protein OC861_006281 [Tilletia horrida]